MLDPAQIRAFLPVYTAFHAQAMRSLVPLPAGDLLEVDAKMLSHILNDMRAAATGEASKWNALDAQSFARVIREMGERVGASAFLIEQALGYIEARFNFKIEEQSDGGDDNERGDDGGDDGGLR